MSWFLNKADTIHKTDDWDFYLCQVDSAPASIFLDLGQKDRAPVKGVPLMCYVRVFMKMPREDGLSSNDEYQTLNIIEDSLEKEIGNKAVYVGRVTTAGRRDFVFYAKDFAAFEKAANKAMLRSPEYEYELGFKEDKDWSVYLGFMYPDARSLRNIMDRRVLESLKDHGDDLAVPRNLDHRVYFDCINDAKAFEKEVVAKGYSIESGNHEPDESSVFVDFYKKAAPQDINDIIDELLPLVEHCRGDYDGWGCEVA
ncbi:DUF695 domain-containing protein [Asticcacaulis machinosus]|uniref:DUF695 domain-containing protein n=1 Tax=Asticcacaulis machinosus TaxID=2984211 RepID=A0ABT5HMZ7_9CAUL|nr:DUF695 domain-containing protein [Asticcacaulis machinosus]MDC7677393.1 DUF695 domain-containing protein [Asticcacaulis machinosus]